MAPLSGDPSRSPTQSSALPATQANKAGPTTNSSRRDVLVSLNGRSASIRSHLADQPDQSGEKSGKLAREEAENGGRKRLQTNGDLKQTASSACCGTPTLQQQETPEGALARQSCRCSHKSAPELLGRHAQSLECVWCSIAKSHSLASSSLSRRVCCTCCCGSIQPQVDSSLGQPWR